MAKLKAPLMSLGASQKLGDALVFFTWKGLNVVREYVIPANPRTTDQVTQRGKMATAVALVHTAQGLAVAPLNAGDVTGYAALANTYADPRTWFNQAVKDQIDLAIAVKTPTVFRDAITTPGANQLAIDISWTENGANGITAANFRYGTSPTALNNSIVAVIAAGRASATILLLTTGQKYYWQLRPSVHADFVGSRSGIYHGTPT